MRSRIAILMLIGAMSLLLGLGCAKSDSGAVKEDVTVGTIGSSGGTATKPSEAEGGEASSYTLDSESEESVSPSDKLSTPPSTGSWDEGYGERETEKKESDSFTSGSVEEAPAPSPSAPEELYSYDDDVRTHSLRDSVDEFSSRELESTKPKTSADDYEVTTDTPMAGEHNDNEEFQYFLTFLDEYFYPTRNNWGQNIVDSIKHRIVLQVYDANNLPLYEAKVKMGRETAYTYQDGEVFFFPDELDKKTKVTIEYEGVKTNFNLVPEKYGRYVINLDYQRDDRDEINVDIVFLMDTTGSMGEEIEQLRDTVYNIYMQISKISSGTDLNYRFGLVLYKDKGDVYVTKEYDFTEDIDLFTEYLYEVTASGGGDIPEDLVGGLEDTLDMDWSDDSIRLVFGVTDAPAQLSNYEDWYDLCAKAREEQIKIFSIGAGGLNTTGEIQLRMLSMLTKGNFIFLTYGETGESSGAGTASDPGKVSHHTGANYVSRELDDIVIDNVKNEIYYLADEAIIADLNENYDYTDEEDVVYRRVDNAMEQIMEQTLDIVDNTKSVLIIPPTFENDSLNDLSTYISSLSEEIILNNDFLTIVNRENLDTIMEEITLKLSGLTDEDDFSELTEANLILAGKLFFVGDNSVLFMRLIDASTSEVIGAARVKI